MASSKIRVLARGSYLVHPQEVGRLCESAASEDFWTPAVLLCVPDVEFALEHAQAALKDLSHRDDVFSDDFTSAVILQPSHGVDLTAVASRLAQTRHFQTIFTGAPVPPKHSSLTPWISLRAYKCIILSSFSVLQAVSQQGTFKSIAVPSRLYATPSKTKPLAGARISIKDNFDLKGVRTTMMNRAYNELYPPRTSSADFITKLTQLGAVIVGKTKMPAFASAEEPTDQWVDYHCPFNPRGDVYQTPSCSSTGAGASLAGYPWLDHSIGSDTSGSVRLPAAFNGLFGLRTSYDIASRRGIVPSCNEFDTVGTLHRSLKDAKQLITATLDVPDSSQFPKRLLYTLDFFLQGDAEQEAMSEEFITVLEKFLGVKRTCISIIDTWASNPPEEAGGKTLLEYLEMVGSRNVRICNAVGWHSQSAVWPMYYDTYHTFDEFRSEYRQKFGKPAYVGPYMRKRWSIAVPFTKDDRAQGVAEMNVFRNWFEKNIMGPDKDTVTDAVMIMPFGSATPKYRDDANKLPSIVGSFSVYDLPPVLQFPALVVPIGQKPYESRISGRKEYLPIVSTLMGAKGSDVLLLNLAEAALKKANWPTQVKTGREAFAIGNNARNVLQEDIEHRPRGYATKDK
ncbi:amidase signature domain protein [Rhypophila decipiens]|uniref:Amidase signature domain protein n=1 Tax=Rhypophila decipiens TaxID=261697 RepID=A0AAN6Y5R4_9PEZI|nr:amidase signature domain protein [Rhypophila decipiens]